MNPLEPSEQLGVRLRVLAAQSANCDGQRLVAGRRIPRDRLDAVVKVLEGDSQFRLSLSEDVDLGAQPLDGRKRLTRHLAGFPGR